MSNEMKDWLADSREEQKAELLAYMKAPRFSGARNRMGCSEDWHDPSYAIHRTFTQEEVESMTPLEVDRLFRLATAIGEGLY